MPKRRQRRDDRRRHRDDRARHDRGRSDRRIVPRQRESWIVSRPLSRFTEITVGPRTVTPNGALSRQTRGLVTLFADFLLVYLKVEPHDELALIRSGNNAAAVSLAGTPFGFLSPPREVGSAGHALRVRWTGGADLPRQE